MRASLFAGQGSQRRGMGSELLARHPEEVALADGILGYSVADLCRTDPQQRLRQTEFAQPALFVVSALEWIEQRERAGEGDFLAGHSLGEVCALFAAGSFDFATGVLLVKRRGELMARATGGGMLALVDVEPEDVGPLLSSLDVEDVDVANYNSRSQVVLSGPSASLGTVATEVRRTRRARCVPLAVSAPFHSRYMQTAATEFGRYLADFELDDPRIPVVANATGEPYRPGEVAELLSRQIAGPVRWHESMRYLRSRGVTEVVTLGPGDVLAGLWAAAADREPRAAIARQANGAEALGSAAFRAEYGVRLAYFAGSMFHGIASVALVARMARSGLLGFLGTGGLAVDEVDAAIGALEAEAGRARFGVNLLHTADDPRLERDLVELYLRHDVRFVEAAAYTHVTAPLVRMRFSGAATDPRHVVAKVSRPDVARAFMEPAPRELVDGLLRDGELTAADAEAARALPVSADVCVEADSGGHTDGGVALALLPAIVRLRDAIVAEHRYESGIRVGAAGGLGAPEAVAAAFLLGADFVCTGSVNQCTPEAGASETVKEMLAALDVHDTTYAPAGDMFELGAQVQVVRRGTLFAARAGLLRRLYRELDGLEGLDARTRRSLEQTCFRRSLDDVWQQTAQHYLDTGRADELARAEQLPKRRMALVFRWYFARSIQLALAGDPAERPNYQIHCGPAMGAFNRFAAGTELEDRAARTPDAIADALMNGAAEVLAGNAQRHASS